MSLKKYKEKRRFAQTPEPAGEEKRSAGALHFVVQKHDASRLHYDFRLELDGVLKSWAVPKGPSLNPADKRLAVMVEDHPFDYRTFEGSIPEGNYGAGTVLVWDEGTYTSPQAADLAEGEALLRDGLAKGRLSFVLSGRKLNGEFSLVKLPRGGKDHWLLIKKNDVWSSEVDVTKADRSVASGRNLDEVASNKRIKWAGGTTTAKKKSAAAVKSPAKRKATKVGEVKPMLATLVEDPFNRAGWLFEVKWDGYRAIAEVNRKKVALYSRNHISFADRFAPVVEALAELDCKAVLDGEVVAVDETGRSQFQLLQNYQKTGEGRLVYYVFDLLSVDGEDLRTLPLVQRKERLADLLGESNAVRLSEHVEEKGVDFFEAATQQDLEGVMAKDGASPYREGTRSLNWLKIKIHRRHEAVVCGYTDPRGSRKGMGALVLGVFEKGGLVYIGHTGGGFDDKELAAMTAKLKTLRQDACPFRKTPKTNAPVHWVEPKLVCEVKFQEWTGDGLMRQPIFLGLREDEPPEFVQRERSLRVGESTAIKEIRKKKTSAAKTTSSNENGEPKALTHLSKIYWPQEGFTKGDLINYYRAIAPTLLPYLHNRPQSLNRHPNGIEAKNFFQKDVSKLSPPDWLQTTAVHSDSGDKEITYALCQDERSLLYLVNLGCIELNPWNARIGSLDRPDYMIVDLDPADVPFEQAIKAAVSVRKLFEKIGVESVCKTSGKRGLHIFVPLGAHYDYDQSRQFAELTANIVHRLLPDTTSVVRSPALRRNRVYLDFLQNRRGQTLAAAYSVRPYPGATVSTPLAWREVRKGLDPGKFTIETMAKRLEKVGDLWTPVLGSGVDFARCLSRLETEQE